MANHNKEKYLPFKLSTYRQDDSYQTLNNMKKTKSDIQVQAQNRKDIEAKHMIEKKLIFGHE